MNDVLLVTDSVRNTNYLVREWNDAGKDLVDYEVVSLADLEKQIALYALAEQGKDLKHEVGANAAAFLIQNLLEKGIEDGKVRYFRSGSLDFATCQEIYNKLNVLRRSDMADSFFCSDDQKICDLRWLLETYTSMLRNNDWLDQTGFLELALSDNWAENWHDENPCSIRMELFGEITAKEKDLLQKLGAVEEERLNQFLAQDHDLHFVKAYGAVNEVRYIADEIRENNLCYGDVAVCYTSDVYEGYLKSVFGAAGIPYAFVTGRAGEDEDYIALAITILKWAQNRFRYEDLLPVFTSPVIRNSGGITMYNNELNSGIGMTLERYEQYIRRSQKELLKSKEEGDFSSDDAGASGDRQSENRENFLETLDSLIHIFKAPKSCYGYLSSVTEWLGKHTSLRAKNRKKDLDALRNLLPDALLIPGKGVDEAVPELLELLDGLKVKDAESASSVSIIHLQEAGVSERSHNYYIGLSAKELEYNTADSPVLSDDELVRFTNGTAPLLARDETKRRTDTLSKLIASCKCEVTLSYSEYDLVNLLQQAESSFYHDCLAKSGASVSVIGFDDSSYRISEDGHGIHIDRNILKNDESASGCLADNKTPQDIIRDRLHNFTFSASSLKTYDDCPRHFYYQKILHLPDIQQQEYKPDQWLSGADLGNLFHGVLQEYVQKCFIDEQKSSFDQKLFDEVFNEQVDAALQKTMYVSENAFHTECKEYRDELTAYLKYLHAFFNDPPEGSDWKVEAVEYPVYAPDGKTGIVIDPDYPDVRFGGRIDRIDSWQGADGKRHYRIVDYKTSRRSRLQKEVDEGENGKKPKTAARRQHDVYMALFPDAEKFEYDLVIDDPSNEEPIRKNRNESHIRAIAEQLGNELFSEDTDIEFNRASKAGKAECCRYCTYQSICRLYEGN